MGSAKLQRKRPMLLKQRNNKTRNMQSQKPHKPGGASREIKPLSRSTLDVHIGLHAAKRKLSAVQDNSPGMHSPAYGRAPGRNPYLGLGPMLGESSVSIYWIESKGLADHFPRTVGSHTRRIEGMPTGRQQRTSFETEIASWRPNIEAE